MTMILPEDLPIPGFLKADLTMPRSVKSSRAADSAGSDDRHTGTPWLVLWWVLFTWIQVLKQGDQKHDTPIIITRLTDTLVCQRNLSGVRPYEIDQSEVAT